MGPSKPLAHSVVGAPLAVGLPAGVTGASPNLTILCEGWVLKKRRKKMQGFARRYFTLYQSGLLSYSFEPGQPARDQIPLYQAAISTAPGRKDIHIDSNTATFHIRCLNSDDFIKWMGAFRKFVACGPEARRLAGARLVSRRGSVKLNKSAAVIEEMGSTLAELESAILAITLENAQKKSSSSSKVKSEKDKHKDHNKEGGAMFGLFKRSSHHSALREPGTDGSQTDSIHSSDHSQLHWQSLRSALEMLKSQHATLVKSIQNFSYLEATQSIHPSPLPFTVEEEAQHFESTPGSVFTRIPAPLNRLSKRTSIATSMSDSTHEWFDALDGLNDGAQEFIMDVQASPNEQPSKLLSTDSRSSLGSDDSSVDTDIEHEQKALPKLPSEDLTHPGALQVSRRSHLPAPVLGDEGSLFAMLKKNVGKDLSTIAFPVTFNEPLTLLQRAAEELEYHNILDQAAGAKDPTDRFCYVAAFAVSGYAHTRYRSGRKGFTPMLAETFEDIRMKFIAEKVQHQPLVIAYHAEGSGWELHATSAGRTKFWGKSLEIIPLGTIHLKIGDEHYSWTKPSSFMRNLMVGTKYLEHCGKMTIENATNHARCILEFKQNSYWATSNVVSGAVHAPDGAIVAHLEGKWDEQIVQTIDSSNFRILWRASPFLKNADEYYGFTSFGMTLNEITSDIEGKLPPTDSRYRPDVRSLEEGNLDVAEEQKSLVEEMQRERRRRGEDRQPRWFKQVGEEWIYVGGYWEARARGWKGVEIAPLW